MPRTRPRSPGCTCRTFAVRSASRGSCRGGKRDFECASRARAAPWLACSSAALLLCADEAARRRTQGGRHSFTAFFVWESWLLPRRNKRDFQDSRAFEGHVGRMAERFWARAFVRTGSFLCSDFSLFGRTLCASDTFSAPTLRSRCTVTSSRRRRSGRNSWTWTRQRLR